MKKLISLLCIVTLLVVPCSTSLPADISWLTTVPEPSIITFKLDAFIEFITLAEDIPFKSGTLVGVRTLLFEV